MRTLITIPAALKDEMNAICAQISPYAANTFSVPYKEKGKTVYVASWEMTPEQKRLFKVKADKRIKEEKCKVGRKEEFTLSPVKDGDR